jgi:hypothetical protein
MVRELLLFTISEPFLLNHEGTLSTAFLILVFVEYVAYPSSFASEIISVLLLRLFAQKRIGVCAIKYEQNLIFS